jgi:hypothetical protein
MVGLTQLGLTFLGGLLSAGAGVAVTRYQVSQQDEAEREDWYHRTAFLARKVQEITNEGGPNFDYAASYELLDQFSQQLYQHDSNAPAGVSTGVSDTLGETAYYCQRAGAIKEGKAVSAGDKFKQELESANQKATKLEQEAESRLEDQSA